LQQAYRDLYLADGPFGPKPIELAFELLFLQPPNVTVWAKRFGLRSWTMDTAPSYLSVFKLQPFDTKTYTLWTWETVDGTPVPPLAVHPRPAGMRQPAPATIFPATDARVTSPDYDTPDEAAESSLLTQLTDVSALLARNPAPAEIEQLETSRAFLRDQLKLLRRGLPADSMEPDGLIPSSPVPPANTTLSNLRADDDSLNSDSPPEPPAPPPTDVVQWLARSTRPGPAEMTSHTVLRSPSRVLRGSISLARAFQYH
jgi:hypothetical protein